MPEHAQQPAQEKFSAMFSRNNRAARIRLSSVLLGCIFLFLICAFSTFAQAALDLEGNPVDPIKASEGKISVLVFVRTDCPISNRYAPLLEHLNDIYADKAKFWLVYPDRNTASQQITDHMRQFHLSIRPLRDPHHSLVKLAKATITPEAVVLDSQGKLLYRGRIDNLYVDAGRSRTAATTHELKDAIESAAFGKIPMPASTPAVGCYISDLE